MIELDEKKIEEFLEKAAKEKRPEQAEKIDRQFADKLTRLESDKELPEDVITKLRVLWKLMREPDSTRPWPDKALIMTALSYFIAPVDVIPDMVGKHGYKDDALVVRIVYRRLGLADEAAS